MNKYAVFYLNQFNIETNIHIEASSAQEAEDYIRQNGVGFSDNQKVYPKRITKVIQLSRAKPAIT